MSSRVRPKLGTQSCAATPWRSAVSRSSRANRRTNDSAEPSQCFQYGSVTSVVKPGSDATSFQSASPCVPSVEGSRQIAFAPPRSVTCASISRRKPTTDASRNACTSGVQLARDRAAEALGAPIAAARPARRVVDADVHGHDPGGLVPEDRVHAALEHPVGPLLAEVAVRGAVETRGRDSPSVVQHLALLGMERDPAALGLAAERTPEPPRARLRRSAPRRARSRRSRPSCRGSRRSRSRRTCAARPCSRASQGRPCPRARGAESEPRSTSSLRGSRSGHDHLILSRRLRSGRTRSCAG